MQRLNKTLTASSILLVGLVVFQLFAGQLAPVQAADPDESTHTGITWGPSYYANDTVVEPARHRSELESMKQVDRQALIGKTWGPSYSGNYTIVAPGTNLNNRPAITWGPSYYANDTNIEPARHRPELESMKQVDLNVLRRVTGGPAYHE